MRAGLQSVPTLISPPSIVPLRSHSASTFPTIRWLRFAQKSGRLRNLNLILNADEASTACAPGDTRFRGALVYTFAIPVPRGCLNEGPASHNLWVRVTEIMAADSSSSGPEKSEISQTVRSCRGCLLYSSIMRDHGRNPVCLGLSGSSEFMVRSDLEEKSSRNFSDFKYACIGYSALKEVSSKHDSPVELPICVGLEFVADGKPSRHAVPAESPSATANSPPPKPLDRQDGPNVMPRPPTAIGGGGGGLSPDEFATRFLRTSRLVASAVMNNMGKVANNVRATIDKILTSDQGRPKA